MRNMLMRFTAFLMVAVMLLANIFITPYYMRVTAEAVRDMIPTLLTDIPGDVAQKSRKPGLRQ